MNAPASDVTRDLITLAQAYSKHEFRTLEALSGMACGKGGFFGGLERGSDCQTATAARVLAWFDRNWPQDLPWPTSVTRPNAGSALTRLPHLDAEFLAGIAHAPIWINGRRPEWWHDVEVRDFLTMNCRQMSIVRAAKKGREAFGDRCPAKSAIHQYWQRIEKLMPGIPRASSTQKPTRKDA